MMAGFSERSSVSEPVMAIRIAGTAAIPENSVTMRVCSRAPAARARSSVTRVHASEISKPIKPRIKTRLAANSETTTSFVGEIGVKSASTASVAMAQRKASDTK